MDIDVTLRFACHQHKRSSTETLPTTHATTANANTVSLGEKALMWNVTLRAFQLEGRQLEYAGYRIETARFGSTVEEEVQEEGSASLAVAASCCAMWTSGKRRSAALQGQTFLQPCRCARVITPPLRSCCTWEQ